MKKLLYVFAILTSIVVVSNIAIDNIGNQAMANEIITMAPAADYPLCMPQGYTPLMQGPSATCYDPISNKNYLAIRCELESGYCTYIDCQPPCNIVYE